METTKWVFVFPLAERKLGLGQISSGLRKVVRIGLARGRNYGT